jgi:hypothetical protein
MLTVWHNAITEKPVHIGIYNVLDNSDKAGWSYWDGQRFGYISRSHKNAYLLRHEPMVFYVLSWRGTTIEQKEVK